MPSQGCHQLEKKNPWQASALSKGLKTLLLVTFRVARGVTFRRSDPRYVKYSYHQDDDFFFLPNDARFCVLSDRKKKPSEKALSDELNFILTKLCVLKAFS